MPRRRRRPVLRVLLTIVLLLAAALAVAAVAAVLLIDPNGFKPQIEAAVARGTGGTVALRGPIRLHPGLPPELVADDIVLTGADGTETLRLARLTARVALLPLLTGEVDIIRLGLLRPDLRLNAAALARANAAPQPGTAAPQAQAREGGPRDGARLRLSVGAVEVWDGQVTWRGTTVVVPYLSASAAAPGASLVLAGQVVSNGQRLMLSGETGPAERLFDRTATAPWPLQIVLQGAGTRLAVRGALAEPLRGRGYALQVDTAATDLTVFAPLLPLPVPRLHDISLSARLTDAGRTWPEVSALTLHVAGLDLDKLVPGLVLTRADLSAPDLRQPAHGDLEAVLRGTQVHVLATVGPVAATLPLMLTAEAAPALQQMRADLAIAPAARPRVSGTVSAGRLDLDALLALLPPRSARAAPPTPAAPAPPQPVPPARTERLIPDRPIDLAPLRAADAELALHVAALQSGGLAYADVTGHLRLQGGRLALDPLSGQSPGGALTGRLTVDASAPVPPVALALHAPSLALAPLAAAFGTPGSLDGTAALDADLTGAGTSPHALAASLAGHLTMSASDADIDNALLTTALGGVLRAARLPANLLGGVGRTKVRCFDLRLDAKGGSVTVAGFVLDTPKLSLQGNGTADLGTETLNLHLRPLVRVGPGVVVPVRVGGTLLEPKPVIDSGAAGRQALLGALAGALAGERGGGDPCAPQAATPVR
jgi:uncharacterized protein involved in outer membrane biogenesis